MSAVATIRARAGDAPVELGIVLGSGLGGLAQRIADAVEIPYGALEGFPASGVTGHRGALLIGRLAGRRVALFAGRAHFYEHGDPTAMAAPLAALKGLGAPAVFLSNAAGSLREDMPPGSLMALSDHIAWSGRNPLIGAEGDDRFVNMTDAYDPELRARLRAAAEATGTALREGVYAWFSGPSFETPAEIRAARIIGADAVGMSTAPETILARRLGLRVAAVSVITNMGAGMSAEDLGHGHTKAEADKAAPAFERLALAFAERFDV